MDQAPAHRRRPIPATIGLIFGGLWFWLGALASPPAWRIPMSVLGALVTLVLIVRLWRGPILGDSGTGVFKRGAYLLAVALEVLAIYAASILLPRYGLQSYMIQVVGAIVGLHFIGLWRATGLTRFLWISGAMCGVAAITAVLPATWGGFQLRDAATGLAEALVLWSGAGRSINPQG